MKIFSFSGIDGAGKSTQIATLKELLQSSGMRVTSLEFWDDVVAFSRWRETMSYRVFKGDQGVGTPEKPLTRRDKNVSSWPVTAMRFLFYVADTVSLWLVVRKLRGQACDAVIFDRYIYDELANLPLYGNFTRWFVKFVIRIAPKPDAAFVLDAVPNAARQRKPEYPIDFLQRNRESYLRLSELAHATVIEAGSIESAQERIRNVALGKLLRTDAELTAVPLAD